MICQEESYTSWCAPCAKAVSKEYADKKNRRYRGLCCTNDVIYNADVVGTCNVLKKYFSVSGREQKQPVSGLSNCFSLTNIKIPENVTSISSDAFEDTEAKLTVAKDSYAESYAPKNSLEYEYFENN